MIGTEAPPARGGRGEQPRAPGRVASVGGLGADRSGELLPGRVGGPVKARRALPWEGPGARRLAWVNLVAAVSMALAGTSAVSGVSALEAPAAIGRWVGSALGLPVGAHPAPSVTDLLPYGKGMWIYEPAKTEGGNAAAIVARARAAGLTHLYVRTGSSWDGFYAGPFLDAILPAAHDAGLMVYGWDFPRLIDVADDVRRAKAAVDHRAPGRHRIDGFSADIETRSEGTDITAEAASRYGAALREAVGESFPLIATVPRPSPAQRYPYAEVVTAFDAIAPMVYWLNRQPDSDVAGALRDLAPFGKPLFPIGQAYDGAPEGGRRGVPPPEELQRFMTTGLAHGAQGVSFWSWQAADERAWAAIGGAQEFRRPARWISHTR